MNYIYLISAFLFFGMPCKAASMQEEAPFADQVLLIFIDDIESDDNPVDKFGIMSSDLLSAIAEQAGPMLASSSLIANISEQQNTDEADPQKLLSSYTAILNKHYLKRTEEEILQRKRIILSVAAFTPEVAQNWVIKEVNPSLYLLLPQRYLAKKGISTQQAQTFVAGGAITQTEQQLGLKINHMKTVSVNDIKKQEATSEYPDYFIDSLNAIFVSNSEYAAHQDKKKIPTWAVYINGHGETRHSVAALSLPQFKEFLTFLATKITTKLLIYSTCYAAGVNAQLIYKDQQSGVDTTYPFTIIAQALTDAPTSGLFLSMEVVHAKLKIKPEIHYNSFVDTVTSAGMPDYRKLMESLDNADVKKYGFASLPQIKLAGLPWFSAVDADKLLSIGSILAKTRTAPLDVSTFTKKGANPQAILLYAQDVPFELIINTKAPETQAPPAIISMIAGNALHHLKKISSTQNSVDALLNGFLTISGLSARKLFLIDEINAPFSPAMAATLKAKEGVLNNVVIELADEQYTIMYKHNNTLYKATTKAQGYVDVIDKPAQMANKKDKSKYSELLRLHGVQTSAQAAAPQEVAELQAKLHSSFNKKITYQAAKGIIRHTLANMPDNVALQVPKITGPVCMAENEECWWNLLLDLANYTSFNNHKVLWIGALETCTEEQICMTDFTDVVIDIHNKHVRVFYTDYAGNPSVLEGFSLAALPEDYMPAYRDMFAQFAQHNRLSDAQEEKADALIQRSSVQQQLTPEAMQKLGELYKKRAREVQAR